MTSLKPFQPPTFGNFAKSSLFKVDAKDVQHSVKLVSTSKEGVFFEPGLIYKDGEQARGYIKVGGRASYGTQVDVNLETDASKSSTLKVSKRNVFSSSFPGVNVSETFSTSEKDFAGSELGKAKYGVFWTGQIDYARQNLALTTQATTDFVRNHSAQATAAVGTNAFSFSNVSVGGDVKAVKKGNENSAKLKEYNAGIFFQGFSNYKNWSLGVQSEDKFQKLKATLLGAKVNPEGTASVGAQVKVDVAGPGASASNRNYELILSLDLIASANTSEKIAIVLPKGNFVASIEHRLKDPNMTLGFTGHFGMPDSTFAPFPFSKFGVSLALGDN